MSLLPQEEQQQQQQEQQQQITIETSSESSQSNIQTQAQLLNFIDSKQSDMTSIFTYIYENCIWGGDSINKSYTGSSGCGSLSEYNREYINYIKNIIQENNYKVIVDIGCGDIKHATSIYDELDIYYFGFDVYDKVIDYNLNTYFPSYKYHFNILDCYNKKEKIQRGDLCIIKDVFSHWSNKCINELLTHLTTHNFFKCILICNCSKQEHDNIDIKIGDYRELSCDFYPLKSYNIKKIFNYNNKEVSVIMCY
jgi:hypothetical protein